MGRHYMPSQHAILSASGSNKWIHCHPSARLGELFDEKPSVYAAEGTEAHSVAEQKLRNWIEGHPRRKVKAANGEMDEATNFYKDYVLEVYNKEKKKSDSLFFPRENAYNRIGIIAGNCLMAYS